MSPKLALILALGLCAYSYYREARRRVAVSRAIWIPTLWMMRCASRGLDAWFSHGGGPGFEEKNTYDQIFIFFAVLSGCFVALRRRGEIIALWKRNYPLLLLYGYLTLSVFWSPIPSNSSRQLFRAFGDLVMASILLIQPHPMEAILTMFRRCMILLIPLSAVLSKYYPEFGRMLSDEWEPDMWIGVATHKNTLGQLLFLSSLVLFVEFFTSLRLRKLKLFTLLGKMRVEAIYMLLTLYLLNAGGSARSSTSIIVLFVGVTLFLLIEYFRSRPRLVPALLVTLLCGLGLGQLASNLLLGGSLKDVIARTQGKDPTLAGRTRLWHDVLEIGKSHPICGAGFAGFWTSETREYLIFQREHWWGPRQAHNGYIETYLQLGIVGVAFLGIVIISGFRGASKALSNDYDYNRLRIVLIVTAIIQNYSEAGFPRPMHVIWFTFLVAILNPVSRVRTAPAPSLSTAPINEPALA